MTNDLVEIFERIEFCRDEIKMLRGEIEKFFKDAITSRIEINENNFQNFFITQTKVIPVKLRSRVGTITNELRSCLDALACQLAVRNGSDTKQVYFPISKSREIFENDGKRKLKKLSHDDQNAIISLHPYRDQNPTLFGLHEADRIRKHIKLVGAAIHGVGSMMGGLFGFSGGTSIGSLVIDGKEISKDFSFNESSAILQNIGTEYLLAENVPRDVEFSVFFGLSYTSPEDLSGKDVCSTLDEFLKTVFSIVENFR